MLSVDTRSGKSKLSSEITASLAEVRPVILLIACLRSLVCWPFFGHSVGKELFHV